ncbi:MAG: ABC transporter permease subunit [Oscillospiraceae bacterium]|nr:ABC transporter permease subunit [Oscillospiraceae bacterium]
MSDRNIPIIAPQKRGFFTMARSQKELLLLSIPFIVYFFIFSYYPLWGLTMAFQTFRPHLSFWEQEWVGLTHFKNLFSDKYFTQALYNTIMMSLINLVLHFVTAITFALFLNELRLRFFKRFVQTISYMPHFLSWIIVCGLMANMLSMDDGIINNLLMWFGIIDKPIHWLGTPGYFWGIVGVSNVWKSMGWNSIIYLAAMTAIDPALYEAAAIDGCGRFGRMWNITLPSIKPTIVILLILNAGWILNAGFEVQYLLGNSGLVMDVSETLDIFVLRRGFGSRSVIGYSYGTAAGMFKTVVSLVVITICNFAAKWVGEERLV